MWCWKTPLEWTENNLYWLNSERSDLWPTGWAHLARCLFPEAMNSCLGSRFSLCSSMPLLPLNSQCWPGEEPLLFSAWDAAPKWGSSSHYAQNLACPTGNMVVSCIVVLWLGQWQENHGNILHFSQGTLQTMEKMAPRCWHVAGNTWFTPTQGIAPGRWMNSSWLITEIYCCFSSPPPLCSSVPLGPTLSFLCASDLSL